MNEHTLVSAEETSVAERTKDQCLSATLNPCSSHRFFAWAISFKSERGFCGSSLVSARDRKFLTTCSEENEQVFDVREEHLMRALACFAMDAIGAFVIIFGLLELRISNIFMLCLMSNEKGSEAFSILSSEIRTINFFKQTFFNFNRLQTRNTFHKTYFSLFSELGGGF